jgi:hypothetical protein
MIRLRYFEACPCQSNNFQRREFAHRETGDTERLIADGNAAMILSP